MPVDQYFLYVTPVHQYLLYVTHLNQYMFICNAPLTSILGRSCGSREGSKSQQAAPRAGISSSSSSGINHGDSHGVGSWAAAYPPPCLQRHDVECPGALYVPFDQPGDIVL